MSDQTPKQTTTQSHAGFNLFTCRITLEVGNVFLQNGRNDNVPLTEKDPAGTIQPIGFVHWNSVFPAPISLSGMVAQNPPGHGIFLLMKNDMAFDLTLLEQDVNSAPINRFDFGGAGPQVLSAGKTSPIVYEPDIERWVSSG